MENLDFSKKCNEIGKNGKTDFDYALKLASSIVGTLRKKDSEYGSSWRRRGGQGAFFQGIARKWDRIETQIDLLEYNLFDVSSDPNSTESIDETLKDLTGYLLLILEAREKIRQELSGRALIPNISIRYVAAASSPIEDKKESDEAATPDIPNTGP